MPGLKLLRRLAITLVVLGVLFVALNIVGERMAESRLASAMQDRFELEQAPTVDLTVFPILTTILRGTLPGISVEAEGLVLEDLEISRLSVELTNVGLEAGGLLGGGALRVSVEQGRVQVRVEQRGVNRYLRSRGEDARVRLSPNSVRVTGTTRVLGSKSEYDATGRLRLRQNTLRFIPDRVLIDGEEPPPGFVALAERDTRFEVEIPELPGGFMADRVSSHDRFVRLTAVLEDASLELTA